MPILLEGKGFKCSKDGFETRDVKEWNDHCTRKEGDSTHITESGVCPCMTCKESVEFEEIPFPPYAENGSRTFAVMCEECAAKGHNKIVIVKRTESAKAAAIAAGARTPKRIERGV